MRKTIIGLVALGLLLVLPATAADPVTAPAQRSVAGPHVLASAAVDDTTISPLVTNGGSGIIVYVTWGAGATGGDLDIRVSETTTSDVVTVDTATAGTPRWLVIYGAHTVTPHLTGTLTVGSVTVRAYTF